MMKMSKLENLSSKRGENEGKKERKEEGRGRKRNIITSHLNN